ncbi:MAG: DNA polymerase III subunit gamma/tau, partial [Ferruginibacter sp.]
ARLTIIDENTFNISVNTSLQQRMVEGERSGLIDCMQEYFNNRSLKYTVTVDASQLVEEPTEKQLSRKQQYQLLTEQYPEIKNLRDRLKLDID